ncbi:MAG TPA: FlgO family outer membrane protein [Blastocatellia bacterium]|nr:FlgO family outer membrane protein [Blastocatellia bacterium]
MEIREKDSEGPQPGQPGDDPEFDMQYRAAARRVKTGAAALVLMILVVAAIGYLAYTDQQPAGSRRIAVLPFSNERPSPETDSLSLTLAEAVINRLGSVNALQVRPPSSIEKYANAGVDTQKAAKELDVDTLLVGSYARDGEDLRVSAHLIDVATGEQLWSEQIDVKWDRLVTLPDHLSRQVVKGLRLNVSPGQ